MQHSDILKQISLFATLPVEVLAKISQITQECVYPAGEFLCYENDVGDRAFLIKSGRVQVLKSADEPDELVLGHGDPGELIGEMAILEQEVRFASVKALEDTTTLEITADDFQQLIIENGTIGYQFIKMLSHRVRESGQDRLEKMISILSVEREMQIARRIQADFLPDELPQLPDWEIAAYFEPAREVGGDFYDAFRLSDNRIGLVIADVSGKGVGAALFMANIRSLIRAFAKQTNHDVLDTIMMTNDYLIQNHSKANMFATLFLGVLDPATGTLSYINAGHNPLFIFNSVGIKTELWPTGPVIGITLQLEFILSQAFLEPGDILLGYTDGVGDAQDPAGNLFTDDRLRSLLATGTVSSAKEWLDYVEMNVRTHIATADQADDITMLAIRRVS